ncbi:hypothetical protein GCK32_004145 [Trichostrongylus colubriformis]|uniref:Transposase Tc1-like domain-containing protein n=1 Tax=Trichostrongylus colubriformis TaxID=6319 RepID=A0AAN8IPD4_TRICO
MSNKGTANTLSVPPETIRPAAQLFETTGGTVDRPRSGRLTTVKTKANVEMICEKIRRNKIGSMGRTAEDMGISEKTVRRIVLNKLRMKNYKIYKTTGSKKKIKK